MLLTGSVVYVVYMSVLYNFMGSLCLLSYREMDKNEDLVQANTSKTLLIRHLPAELSQDEKEDLLKYFGAESVRVFSNRGRLVGCASLTLKPPLSLKIQWCPFWTVAFPSPQKHAAFATFRSEKSAAKVSIYAVFVVVWHFRKPCLGKFRARSHVILLCPVWCSIRLLTGSISWRFLIIHLLQSLRRAKIMWPY